MIKETFDKNEVKEIVDKVDELFVGYENKHIISALVTLMTWCIVNIHIDTGMEINEMVNQIHQGLTESTKIQLNKEKEVSN